MLEAVIRIVLQGCRGNRLTYYHKTDREYRFVDTPIDVRGKYIILIS